MFISLGAGAILALALIVVVSLATNGNSAPQNALDGHRVAPFTLSSLATGTVASPWSTGHPAVVIFFASWCTPCKAELPRVATWVAHHALGDVRVIGVDVNDETVPARAFVAHASVRFPVGTDPRSVLAGSEFDLPGLPDAVFVRGNGTVASVVVGAVSDVQLTTGVSSLQS
jgi:thiol-disulfide isomerase/thioredoxin